MVKDRNEHAQLKIQYGLGMQYIKKIYNISP